MGVMSIAVSSFAEIEEEFLARIVRHPWCNVATVDGRGRPRSRILHPVWEGATGWIGTRPYSHKARHLARLPYVSVAYVADVARPVYVDCAVRWIAEAAEKRRVWAVMTAAPPPMGYDPAPVFGSADSAEFGLLQLTPWRVEVATLPLETRVWHADRLPVSAHRSRGAQSA